MINLPDEAHQPRSFNFPKKSFGKTKPVKRSFQPSWFDKWPWLHYNESDDSVLCFTCAQANAQKKLQWSTNADTAFISKGFSNWKDATVKFALHLSSNCHKESVLKMITMPSSSKNVAESLSAQVAKNKLERRQCFLKILSNIRFLALQGLPLRGHGDEKDDNFFQLMKLRGEDDPRIDDWLHKKTNKYTAPDIQNEILRIMGLSVLRKVMDSLHVSPFFSIMIDETTDVSNNCMQESELSEVTLTHHQVQDTIPTSLP